MKLSSVCQVALLAVVSALPGVAAQSIDDVFVVHRGSGAGSCDARRQLLDKTHFPEALALTQAALSAITNYKTSRPARDQLSAFFGIKFQPESAGYAVVDDVALGTVTNVYAKLQELFNGQAQLPGGKPGLFCGTTTSAAADVASSDELSPHSHGGPDDVVYVEEHANGGGDALITTTITTILSTIVQPASAPTQQLPPPPPPSPPQLTTTTTITAAAPDQPVVTLNIAQPASPAQPAAQAEGTPSPPPPQRQRQRQQQQQQQQPVDSALLARQSACRSSLRGFALTGATLTSVTLCPLAFETTDRAPTLDEIVVTQGKVLDECDARSQTLLHEGIHIMLRGENSPDSAYGAAKCLKLVAEGRVDDARRNPDSFGFFALASWLAQKDFAARHHRGTQRWQFHTGVATPQEQP